MYEVYACMRMSPRRFLFLRMGGFDISIFVDICMME